MDTLNIFDKNIKSLICNSLVRTKDMIDFIDERDEEDHRKLQHILILHDWYEYLDSDKRIILFLSPCITHGELKQESIDVTMTTLKNSRGAILDKEHGNKKKKNIFEHILVETLSTIDINDLDETLMYPIVKPICVSAQNNSCDYTYGQTDSYLFEYIMLHALCGSANNNKCLYIEDTVKLPIGRPVHLLF